MSVTGKGLESQIRKLVKDLSDPEFYPRKHAAWTLARMVQTGKARDVAAQGSIPPLVGCLKAPEAIVRGRALWALAILASHGDKDAVLKASNIPVIEKMASDTTELEICESGTSEIERTTIGALAKQLLELSHQ